jgi:dihydroxy-acid dehydratase
MAAVRDGDIIVIDIASRKLDLDVPAETMKERLAGWRAPQPRYATGVLGKYARLVSSASLGAVTG